MNIREGFNNLIRFFLILAVIISAASGQAQNPTTWPQKKLDNWFEKQEWGNGWDISPHESVDKRKFALSYFENPEKWQKVFDFLANTDLVNSDCENITIDDGNILVYIQPYLSMSMESAPFKSHKEYISLHYVIEGEELIGVTDSKGLDDSDSGSQNFAIYDNKEAIYFKADPQVFFLFFPGEVYCSGVKAGDPGEVKKLVVMIKEESNSIDK